MKAVLVSWARRALWSSALLQVFACVEGPVEATSAELDAEDASVAAWDAGDERPQIGKLPEATCGVDDLGPAREPGDSSAEERDRDGGVFASDAGPVLRADASDDVPSLPRPSRAGDLVITELMVDPAALSDTQGEWFELYNASSETLTLEGCVVDDGSSTRRAFGVGVVLEAFAYAAVARSESPGFVPDVVLSVSFTNTADTLAVVCDGVEIDRVSYDKARGFPLLPGKSLSLDPSRLDAVSNDAADAWCAATASYGGDWGTPGVDNPSCTPAASEPAEEQSSDTP